MFKKDRIKQITLCIFMMGIIAATSTSCDSNLTKPETAGSQNAGTQLSKAQTHQNTGPTYYVAIDGSDKNGDGSQSNPWATITYATNQATDGSTILVRPGTYTGRQRIRGRYENGITIRSKVAYEAKLRNKAPAPTLTCYYCEGITIEGFDIAQTGPRVNPGAGFPVIQIQDGLGSAHGPSDGEVVSDIILRNNVLHDGYTSDILKIGNGAINITVADNIFYNQTGHDEHIDVNSVKNVTVQDNIFFNDFAGSGRDDQEDTGSYIVIKDSNGDFDDFVGNRDNIVQRNVFLNWEGSSGTYFIQVGGDNKSYYSAYDIMIQNNLLLGNSKNVMRAPLAFNGVRDITYRFNTIVGNLPSLAYGMRGIAYGKRPVNKNIAFYGNIWSDPTGTMGAESFQASLDFSDTPIDATESYTLKNNLYWNDDIEIPADDSELINYTDDKDRVVGDPLLPVQNNIVLPRWNSDLGQFSDGSKTVREAFKRLVKNYGIPSNGSAAIDAGSPDIAPHVPKRDILRQIRTGKGHSDVGAYAAGNHGD